MVHCFTLSKNRLEGQQKYCLAQKYPKPRHRLENLRTDYQLWKPLVGNHMVPQSERTTMSHSSTP